MFYYQNALPDKGYFISIGADRKMFTLRQGNSAGKEWHIQNLSHTWEEAEKKAFEVTGLHLPAPECILNPLKAHETIDTAIMQWGKYKDMHIKDIAKEDVRYLAWVASTLEEDKINFPDKRPDRTKVLISQLPEVIAYNEEQERLKKEREEKWEAERKAEQEGSEHIGEVGDRIEFTGTVSFTRSFENDYGFGFQTKLVTDDGNVVIYWNLFGAEVADFGIDPDNIKKIDAEKGDRITFRAAVKKHDEFKGVKQTVISRATKCKLLSAGKESMNFLSKYLPTAG